MNDQLIINGITYRKVEPPVEEKRIEGFVDLKDYGNTWWAMSAFKTLTQKTRMIEIRDGERVLSRDAVIKVWTDYGYSCNGAEGILESLGFDKC